MVDDDADRTHRHRNASSASAPRGRRRWPAALVGVLAALALIGGALAAWGFGQLSAIKRDAGLLPSAPSSVQSAEASPQSLDVLLLGSDSRGEARGRSDVMMLLHSDPDRAKVYLISLPRDLWVPIPGHGMNKINAAYALGGAPLAVRTVERLLGVSIDHVALTDFEGFFRLVDDLGGVQVFNEHASHREGFTFPRGELHLTGESALAYVRDRNGLPRGDLDRAERQRLVVKAIVSKLASSQTLTDPGRLVRVLNRLSQSVTVDGSLTNDRILSLARELRIGSGDDIEQLQLPVSDNSPSTAGQLRPDTAGVARLAEALASGRMDDYQP